MILAISPGFYVICLNFMRIHSLAFALSLKDHLHMIMIAKLIVCGSSVLRQGLNFMMVSSVAT